MNALTARLDRVTATLTAKERAILTIRAELAGQDVDPELKRTMPDEQHDEFRRYMLLFYVVNAELGTVVICAHREVHTLRRLASLGVLLDGASKEASADLNEEVEGLTNRQRRGSEKVNLPTYLDGLANECRLIYLEIAVDRWKEMRALEVVLGELRAEFDGEETLRSDLRDLLSNMRELLLDIFEDCGRKRRPPEAPEQLIDSYRDHVKNVLRLFGLEAGK